MSDDQLDKIFEEFKDTTAPKFVKKLEENKVRPDGEIEGMLTVARAFLLGEQAKPLEEREFFKDDDYGYQITFFKIDNEPKTNKAGVVWNGPQNTDKPLEAKLSVQFPLKEGKMDIKLAHAFFTKGGGKLSWGSKIWARGHGWVKYSPLEDMPLDGYEFDAEKGVIKKGVKGYFFREEFLTAISWADKVVYKRLSDVPKTHYNRYPGFRMFQLLKEWK